MPLLHLHAARLGSLNLHLMCACIACVLCAWCQVRPIEEAFKFSHFFSPLMTESDFDAKPSILLLGQYSTGKVGKG